MAHWTTYISGSVNWNQGKLRDDNNRDQGSNWGGQWGFGHLKIGIFGKLVTLEISKNSLYRAFFSTFLDILFINIHFRCKKQAMPTIIFTKILAYAELFCCLNLSGVGLITLWRTILYDFSSFAVSNQVTSLSFNRLSFDYKMKQSSTNDFDFSRIEIRYV